MNLNIPDIKKSDEKSRSYLEHFLETTSKFMNRSKSPYVEVPRVSNTDSHGSRRETFTSVTSRVRQFPTMEASPSKSGRKSNASFFQDKRFSGQILRLEVTKSPEEAKLSPITPDLSQVTIR
jgi:hypothetical protein